MEDLIVYVSLILSVMCGGLLVVFAGPTGGRTLKLLLAFSGAFLLSVSFLHLIPEVYGSGTTHIGLFILIGFLFQLLLEFFSDGIEHGHVHVHHHRERRFPIVLMISLCIHAFVEGIPLEREIHHIHHETHDHGNHSLLLGVVFHNIPVSIALVSMFIQSGMKRSTSILWLSVFAIMGPLGTFSAHVFGEDLSSLMHGFFDRILALVVGMFLHISTTILFESSEGHRFNLFKFLSILAGAGVAIITH